ncbi:MAG: pilus assembly protein TadG-related protein [Anaerolineae bacterium]|nr:pilus assembly protein TadG-related protein [Anaerolineae bacterium]MDK1081334.1 pilus assembly protein TadG-related protein [Anaerolineae bacterium]
MKIINWFKKRLSKPKREVERLERGQVLIIVTLAMIGLVAFVGLVVDVGLVFIANGNLRRSVDSAALAAASNFRRGYEPDSLNISANEFFKLNGFQNSVADVNTCETLPGDPELCPEAGEFYRKLVRVTATVTVPLAFLRVIGIDEVPITAVAIGEAASLDVVLVIDTSESMSKDTKGSDCAYGISPDQCDRNASDPNACNVGNKCKPFDDVKLAARDFVDQLDYPYDRVALINFQKNVKIKDYKASDPAENYFSNVKGDINSAINELVILEPGECTGDTTQGLCLLYEYDEEEPPNKNFLGMDCPTYHSGTTPDPSKCTTTNIGGGVAKASKILDIHGRVDALWVVIVLTDGAANASFPKDHCPNWWWENPFCRDGRGHEDPEANENRNCWDDTYEITYDHCLEQEGAVEDELKIKYNTDDYARDQFDVLGIVQEARIYTIGLGGLVKRSRPIIHDKGSGERLLIYGAEVGNGEAIFALSGNQLEDAFNQILDSMATRLRK